MEQEKNKEALTVPAFVFEASEYRADRKNKRLWITIMSLIGLLLALIITTGIANDTY